MKPIHVNAAAGLTRARRVALLRAGLFATALLVWPGSLLTAQGPAGLWAAQTGPDQVTLVWNEVPGATEYRIHLGVLGGTQPPIQRLSGSARRTVLVGVQRVAGGVFLVGAGPGGRVLRQAQFNPVTAVTSFPPVAAPAEVTAEATAATEVTLSWPAVPGATAYYIGRAVTGSGFRQLCGLCSTATSYQDRSALPGLTHTYAVSAIFPNGTSRRVSSNPVDPGAPTISEVPATSGTLTQSSTTPTTSTVTATSTTTTTSSTSTSTSGTLTTALSGALGAMLGPVVTPPSGLTASIAGPAAVRLGWQPSTAAGVTEYRLYRRVNGGSPELLNTVPAGTTAYVDAFFPITLFATGPVRVSYNIAAATATSVSDFRAVATGELTVQPPTTGTSSAATTASCKLDYQRADNMWAQYGRPDGPLGTETITLAGGQDKVFTTDWKYEKQRNDGTNYYGSHLRIATNGGPHTIRLQLRTLTLTGLLVWARTGSDTFWIRMDPGKTLQFQADLMEVFCEN